MHLTNALKNRPIKNCRSLHERYRTPGWSWQFIDLALQPDNKVIRRGVTPNLSCAISTDRRRDLLTCDEISKVLISSRKTSHARRSECGLNQSVAGRPSSVGLTGHARHRPTGVSRCSRRPLVSWSKRSRRFLLRGTLGRRLISKTRQA